jgi:uncharacterized protein YqhQ
VPGADPSAKPKTYGGQAVIEGVMMRGQRTFAVACRAASGEIVVHAEPLTGAVYQSRWSKIPFVRGAIMIWDTLALGIRALMFAANVAAAEEGKDVHDSTMPATVMWSTILIAIGGATGLFFVMPVLAMGYLDQFIDSSVVSNVVEKVIRLGLILGYMFAIGQMPDIKRVFQYHGAEHKTINAFEAGWPLDVASVRRASLLHPRCGTGFLLVVLVVSVVVFSVVAVFHPNWFWLIASRVVAIPLIAGLGFELIRFMARNRRHPVVRVMLLPVLGTQKFTTREPSDDMLEVAITAFNSARQGEEETAGAAA